MTFLIKFLIVCVFVVVASGKSINLENIFERLNDTNCSCDWRFFKHYETKGCVLASINSCSCPEKFVCSFNKTLLAASKVCTYRNKEYKVGSKIITSDVCQVCRCHDGVPPYISCVTRECLPIDGMLNEDCHLIYKDNKCCPTGVECVKGEDQASSNKTCEYDGRIYPFGSKIYLADDPCQICVCDENWKGGDNFSCYQQDCLFERNKAKLDAGCIPIYHESRCCPVEFYCPSRYNLNTSSLSMDDSSENYNATNDQCAFHKQFYAIGEELSIGNPCVKCTCIVPPEFTCVHQSCPPSPNKEGCYANYNSGTCCPSYECMLGDSAAYLACPTPLCADASCKIEIPLGHSCPTCVCKGCPTPMCANSSCRIETPRGHDCPTCVCGESTSELEHNNLEQVQQINQNFDEMEHAQKVSEPYPGSTDYSEDELQMMPITMQEAEGQSPFMEKMIALSEVDSSENIFSEDLAELNENSFEDNSSLVTEYDEENSTHVRETDVENFFNESTSNHSEKVQKRSNISDAASNDQSKTSSVERMEFPQQAMQEINENIEKEGSELDGGYGYFEDELESSRNRAFNRENPSSDKRFTIIIVPQGCPTPMCEGPWCKIEIPPGRRCPTCICRRGEP